MSSNDLHSIVMALISALFRTHARPGMTVMTDVYCDLRDEETDSVRAPDVVLVSDLAAPKGTIYVGKPILAVEIRATQSKLYLEEKVKLYLEHGWPCTWLVHVERRELEVVRPGVAPVIYRGGVEVPLVPELDKHGLTGIPAEVLFDDQKSSPFNDEWVARRERSRSVLAVLGARGLAPSSEVEARVLGERDLTVLERWLILAATASSMDAFARGLG